MLSAGGGCEQLGIKPADFMLNKPAWLGDAPVVSDIADTEDCDVLVIGAGNAGTVAALRCQEEGANVFLADMQTYDEYDEYACDMACYNSKLFLDKGTPEIDTTEVFNEYMRLDVYKRQWFPPCWAICSSRRAASCCTSRSRVCA